MLFFVLCLENRKWEMELLLCFWSLHVLVYQFLITNYLFHFVTKRLLFFSIFLFLKQYFLLLVLELFSHKCNLWLQRFLRFFTCRLGWRFNIHFCTRFILYHLINTLEFYAFFVGFDVFLVFNKYSSGKLYIKCIINSSPDIFLSLIKLNALCNILSSISLRRIWVLNQIFIVIRLILR